MGELRFERLQIRRRSEYRARVRERTLAAVAARRTRQPVPDRLPFEGLA